MNQNDISLHQERVSLLLEKIRKASNLPKLPTTPTIPDREHILAQAKLILEETIEVLEACGISISTLLYKEAINRDSFILTTDTSCIIDLPSVAKEIADLSVVTTGMFSEFGIADGPVLRAVDINNLAKIDGGHLDENRKWQKPLNHPKPDIKAVLMQQGWIPSSEVSKDETQNTNIPVSGRRNK